METNRLEAFSDGVFAIAVTLLILEVRLPAEQSGSLAHRLGQAWPQYVSYVISFVTIGIMWANHHAIFRLIARASHGLVVANLFLLLSISFVPFPTKVLGDYLRGGGNDRHTAAVFYSASFVLTAIFFNLLWQIASRGNRLIAPGNDAAVADISRRYRYGIPSYLAATIAGIWSVPLSLAIDGGLALLYVLPQRELS